jgi:hypothetical protein
MARVPAYAVGLLCVPNPPRISSGYAGTAYPVLARTTAATVLYVAKRAAPSQKWRKGGLAADFWIRQKEVENPLRRANYFEGRVASGRLFIRPRRA